MNTITLSSTHTSHHRLSTKRSLPFFFFSAASQSVFISFLFYVFPICPFASLHFISFKLHVSIISLQLIPRVPPFPCRFSSFSSYSSSSSDFFTISFSIFRKAPMTTTATSRTPAKKRNRSRTLIRYFIRTNFYICECRAKRWTRIAHPQSTFPNSTADKLLFVALFFVPSAHSVLSFNGRAMLRQCDIIAPIL